MIEEIHVPMQSLPDRERVRMVLWPSDGKSKPSNTVANAEVPAINE